MEKQLLSSQMENSKKVCFHIAASEAGDLSFIRYFTGNGSEYYLVCSDCAKNNESLEENLRELKQENFTDYDKQLFTNIGFEGHPQIKFRKAGYKFEFRNVKLKREITDEILDFKPLETDLSCEILAFTKTKKLLKIDLQSNDYIELCSITEETNIDLEKEISIKLSRDGKFCAVFNPKGQYGVVIDTFTGKVLMQLDRGDYHNEVSIFPVAFIEWKGTVLIIHGTAWNKLDISDPLSTETITKRSLENEPKVENGELLSPDHYLDYFHSSIIVSDNCEWVVDNGWIWHPIGEVVTCNIKKWIEDNVWESEDGSSRKVLCYREYYWNGSICWVDENRVAVYGFGDDDDYIIPAVRIFDVVSGKELYWFAGPDNWLVFDEYLFSAFPNEGIKVWDVNSGELLHNDKSFCPEIYHKGSKYFISQISPNDYKLGRLIKA